MGIREENCELGVNVKADMGNAGLERRGKQRNRFRSFSEKVSREAPNVRFSSTAD
jgi:hypothetical protein